MLLTSYTNETLRQQSLRMKSSGEVCAQILVQNFIQTPHLLNTLRRWKVYFCEQGCVVALGPTPVVNLLIGSTSYDLHLKTESQTLKKTNRSGEAILRWQTSDALV